MKFYSDTLIQKKSIRLDNSNVVPNMFILYKTSKPHSILREGP